MSYYQESIESIEQVLEQTIPDSGVPGAFGRYFVEEWLDKDFKDLPEPSYDEDRVEIDKMDHCFSVVLAYRYGMEKDYIPDYAVELFLKLESMNCFETLIPFLKAEDKVPFLMDLKTVREHRNG